AVGKWHVTLHIGADGPRHNWPLQRGFDSFYGMVSGAGSFFDPYTLTRGNTRISPCADPEYRPETYYFTDALTDHAVRFLRDHDRDHATEPFFLYLTYTAAHWPMHALAEDIARYRGRYDQGYEPIRRARFEKAAALGLIGASQRMSDTAGDWASVADTRREAACMEVYAAMIDRMDQGIGRIVAELRRTGRFENTLILFLQDNGGCAEEEGRRSVKDRLDGPRPGHPTLPPLAAESLCETMVPRQTRDGYPVRQGPRVVPGPADTFVAYGRGWANVSNTPFREYKHWVHEGGISTPLIAHWPAGMKSRGGLCRQPGHLIDVMATCIDVAGASFPAEQAGEKTVLPEGRSLVPAFNDQPIARDALYWEHEGNRAIREGDWKLVARGPRGRWELYDMATDRVESKDLANKQPEIVARLTRKWEAWAHRAKVLPWIWKPAYDADRSTPASEAAGLVQ
ncbi:MAG: sulfatase-like hydrolase/transferase, partial [Isosphaeraceae bacterium]